MMKHPGVSGSKLAAEARKRVAMSYDERLLTHASSLAKEHDLFPIKAKYDELWSSTMTKLSEGHFAFAIAASVDSLPHNANLCQ